MLKLKYNNKIIDMRKGRMYNEPIELTKGGLAELLKIRRIGLWVQKYRF